MATVQLACADLRSLCESVQAAQMNAARGLLRDLASSVASAGDMLQNLPAELRAGRAESYTRHIAYADPHGAFTVAYLIWRPGQFSPVHGHKTWCTYQVLQGDLTETHYRWNEDAAIAVPCGEAVRRPGEIVTASQGLRHIHRLGNGGDGIAVSLHIYGVDQADLSSGVNHLVDTAPAH